MNEEYIKLLEAVASASKIIMGVTDKAFSHKDYVLCPHGNWPNYPTHAWWCDDCWNNLKDALEELQSFQQSVQADLAPAPHVCNFENGLNCPTCGKAVF